MTANQLAKQHGAKLTKVPDCSGMYELRVKEQVFTLDHELPGDAEDSRERRWFIRPGAFPGGAPFDWGTTLAEAVVSCLRSAGVEVAY